MGRGAAAPTAPFVLAGHSAPRGDVGQREAAREGLDRRAQTKV
jgi:hypothetical protein